MTDHANELRRHARKIPNPQGETPGVMLRAADEIERLRAKIERMEQQEPVWFIDERGEPKRYHKSKADYCKYGGLDLLYTLPGAKGEKK